MWNSIIDLFVRVYTYVSGQDGLYGILLKIGGVWLCLTCVYIVISLISKIFQMIFSKKQSGEKSGCGCFSLIIIIVSIFLIIIYRNGNNGEIINVRETMASTINQYNTFSLPTRIPAKMGDSSSKAVDIDWDKPISIDTSNVGVKVFNGKVEGYSELVNYTLTILPNPTINELTSINTQNSMIKYNISFGDSIKWAWFKISKNEQTENQFMPVISGIMNDNLYLPFGPGVYQIDILTSSDSNVPSKGENEYYHISNIEINNEDNRDMSYLMPDTYVESDSVEIINLANEITQGCFSDMEKTKAIHDWVATHIAYDVKALYSGDIREYSALDTLHGKQAVCNGYANLTAALNRSIGIKTKIISGTATNGIANNNSNNNGHAWNETYIEDRWVIQDTTWDAGSVNEKKTFEFDLSHKYFDPDPKKFAEDHTKISQEP